VRWSFAGRRLVALGPFRTAVHWMPRYRAGRGVQVPADDCHGPRSRSGRK